MDENRYLKIDYLIKYGYFDFKNSNTQKSFMDENEDKYISSNTIYKGIFNCDELYNNLEIMLKLIDSSFYGETEAIQFSCYKNEEERRGYKYSNMYSYINLSQHIHNNMKKYGQILEGSSKSLSNKFYNRTFLQGKILKYNNRLGKRRIFKADIENFYPSIYTHSIPWVLEGKLEAKKNKSNKSIYYNELDSLIQRCQYGETHGIPTGSFTSRVIAEIYMCKVDEKLSEYSYVRYVDDFELAYNKEEEQIKFYNALYKELKSLNLKIKKEKNIIDIFPFEAEEDIDDIFGYIANKKERCNRLTLSKEKRIIYSFIEFASSKERDGKKGALKLLFKALKHAVINSEVSEEAWLSNVWEYLFNIILLRPQISSYYLELIDSMDREDILEYIKQSLSKMKVQIEDSINRYIELEYSEELCAILSICYSLNNWQVICKEHLLLIINKLDDFNSIIAMEIYLKSDVIEWNKLFEVIENKLGSSYEWCNEFWLFKYQMFYKLKKEKGLEFEKEYKEYLYNKYSGGKNKGVFFDKRNIKKINSPIILEVQNKSGNALAKFYKNMLNNNITFFIYK
ncbi:RNA-directed DNA polymerase [Clostridium gasigenes]|uniref:Reverse transcriptase (RNA-dependent DNA polymerase) n=1 Tax=Clostridium gasigenes TaxID=94869 RepID=A0A1H0VG36_9CLOT|nr:RNA-directed DNA polymerase [Clostridium gasigenes]SDP77410.1 Reverse transcriptase (RNA-dependent DNA polymerase) [Clostridium gasigenes]